MDGRCGWAGPEQIYLDYHDHEWGVPCHDSRALFEMLVLEGFQAGLNWITILKKRAGFRVAFQGFDPQVMAGWGPAEVDRPLADPGIVRHRGKIETTLRNARAFLEIEGSVGFATYLWCFVDGAPVQGGRATLGDVPAQTEISVKLSKDLKRRGFGFVGPTTVYAFMQASGMVNDHVLTCPRHAALAGINPAAAGDADAARR